MKDYIKNLEKEFSKITNGFKQIEKKALYDLKSNNNSYIKELAYTAYKSDLYQVRMYSVFLFGYLSEKKKFLIL